MLSSYHQTREGTGMTAEEARRIVKAGNIESPRYWEAKAALPALEREEARDLDAALTARVAAANAKWTREYTIEQRTKWNAAVKSGKYGKNVAAIIKATGINPNELKAHVERHGL
jgi:hypothetical protein